MILEIEYYKNDTFLSGKTINAAELKKQLNETEQSYDIIEDNFIETLCRAYRWTVIETDEVPDFIYDRDIKRLYKPEF